MWPRETRMELVFVRAVMRGLLEGSSGARVASLMEERPAGP